MIFSEKSKVDFTKLTLNQAKRLEMESQVCVCVCVFMGGDNSLLKLKLSCYYRGLALRVAHLDWNDWLALVPSRNILLRIRLTLYHAFVLCEPGHVHLL